jgi:hypothetical protein
LPIRRRIGVAEPGTWLTLAWQALLIVGIVVVARQHERLRPFKGIIFATVAVLVISLLSWLATSFVINLIQSPQAVLSYMARPRPPHGVLAADPPPSGLEAVVMCAGLVVLLVYLGLDSVRVLILVLAGRKPTAPFLVKGWEPPPAYRQCLIILTAIGLGAAAAVALASSGNFRLF